MLLGKSHRFSVHFIFIINNFKSIENKYAYFDLKNK